MAKVLTKKVYNPPAKMVAVYEMLKDGKDFSFDKMVSKLACSPTTAMVLICALRRDFDAKIESVRDGRKVIAYRLDNASALASKMVAKAKAPKTSQKTASKKVSKTVSAVSKKSSAVLKTASKTAKVKQSSPREDEFDVPTLDADLSVTEISDSEMADLRHQLGL